VPQDRGIAGARKRLRAVGGGALFLLLAGTAAGQMELVSKVSPSSLSDTGAGAASYVIHLESPAISADGRYVAFVSAATNLAPGQSDANSFTANSQDDVFLHDRITGATTLVSHSRLSPTVTADHGGEGASLSADGRWVAYISESTDLVDGQPDGIFHPRNLFLYDALSGTTTWVSPSTYLGGNNGFGVRQMAISADGRFLAFTSDAPDLVPGQQDGNHGSDVFLYDRTTGTTALVSHAGASATMAGNGDSQDLSISADGRFVAFDSVATDLSPGQAGSGNVFLYDRLSGTVSPIGRAGIPRISADGGVVVFFSNDDHLAPGQIDTNGAADVFLYDRRAGTTILVSHAAGLPTTAANASSASFDAHLGVSADGRFVAFLSYATNLVPGQVARPGPAVFLYDRTSGEVTLASRAGNSPTTPGSGPSRLPSISADGRFVAFESDARDLVAGQVDAAGTPDIFLFDRNAGTTTLASAASGAPATTGSDFSYAPVISADGSQIVFYSDAGNLVAGAKDFNGGEDVILHDTASGSNAYATPHAPGSPSLTPDGDSSVRGMSGDGRYVLIESTGLNLVAGQLDANRRADVFLRDRATGSNLLVSRAAESPVMTGDNESGQSVLSADGRYVAFASLASDLVAGVNDRPIDPDTGVPMENYDVFLYDWTAGSTTLVSRSGTSPGFSGDRASAQPAISADGRYVAFASSATDLIRGLADTNQTSDVFLFDRVTGATILVSRSSAAGPPKTADGASTHPLLSADGRYVAYESEATDLVPGQTDIPGAPDVFLFDRVTGTTTLVSHSRGNAADAAGVFGADIPSLSADGRYVLFSSYRTDLADVTGQDVSLYLYDRVSGSIALAGWFSSSNQTRKPTLSADGRWIAFVSNADGLVPGFANFFREDQAYLYDRVSRTLTLLTPSLLSPGQVSQGHTENPSISADGRYVAFDSNAPDLVPGQAGAGFGVFLYDRVSGARTVVSRSPTSPATSVGGFAPLVSADGRSVAFDSASPDLVPGDFNRRTDVFLSGPAATPGGPVPIPPCKVFDGLLRSNVRQALAAAGSCGVPGTAKGLRVKVTARRGTAQGNVRLYPGSVTAPAVGTLRFQREQTVSASFDLPPATTSAGAVLPFVPGNGKVRVTVEVEGYIP
jgi:Tol biopolymer transport system component